MRVQVVVEQAEKTRDQALLVTVVQVEEWK